MRLELSVSMDKTKLMRLNNNSELPLLLIRGEIKEVSSFITLGSIMSSDGGTDDFRVRKQLSLLLTCCRKFGEPKCSEPPRPC